MAAERYGIMEAQTFLLQWSLHHWALGAACGVLHGPTLVMWLPWSFIFLMEIQDLQK